MILPTPAARLSVLCLALVLAVYSRPAEGLTFYEQREPFPLVLPQLESHAFQVVQDLSGDWEYYIPEDESSGKIWLPGCFSDETEMVFRRLFVVPDSLKDWRFELYLPETSYKVEIRINDDSLMTAYGAHQGIMCPVLPKTGTGSVNTLELRVSNRLTTHTTLPVRPQVMQPQIYGGIFSGIYLRAVPAWSIQRLTLTTSNPLDPAGVQSTVRLQIVGGGQLPARADSDSVMTERDIRVAVALWDTAGLLVEQAISGTVRGSGAQEVSVPIPRFNAALWSPDQPLLYRLTAALMAGTDTLHTLTQLVGFKSVVVQEGRVLLNGQPFAMRGVDYIPEEPTGRRAISAKQLREDFLAIRELGMNVVRVPNSPPSPLLLGLADEIGLLVMAELPLAWTPTEILAQASYQSLLQDAAWRMVSDLGSHVSILGWGIGSHLLWEDAATLQTAQALARTIRERDNHPYYAEADLHRIRELEKLGVICLAAMPSQCDSLPDPSGLRGTLPTVVSHVGRLAASQGTILPGPAGQTEFIKRSISQLASALDVDGFLLHAFADYHGKSPLLMQPGQHDPALYTFGLVDFNRNPRPSYLMLKQDNTVEAPDSADAAPEQRVPNPAAFPLAGLIALLLLSAEMRRNNVFRANLKRVFVHAHGFYSDLRYRRFLHTTQPLFLLLLESLTLSLLLSSLFYVLRENPVLDYYLSHILPWPDAKAWIVNLIWDPLRLVLYFTVLFIALIVTQIVLVRITAMLFTERVDLWQSANYVIWAFAALLYLLPLAIVFYRMLANPQFAMAGLVIAVGGMLWSFIRLLGALRTGFGTSPLRVYTAVLAIGFLLLVITGTVLEYRLGTLTYLQFFHDMLSAPRI